MEEKRQLIKLAYEQTKFSYAPYSGFCVGAALLAESGKIYLGSNVENASFGAGICAERSAFGSAVSGGETSFLAIAVAGGRKGKDGVLMPAGECVPCGICLQVMEEFCGGDFRILLAEGEDGPIKERRLNELLPFGFGKTILKPGQNS